MTEYDHDNTNQLTAADHTGQTDESLHVRRKRQPDDVGLRHRLTTTNWQLTASYNYTYDAEGNRLTQD